MRRQKTAIAMEGNMANILDPLAQISTTASVGRRAFIAALGGAAAWPLAARAQEQRRLPTIGFLGQNTRSAASEWVAALVQRLRELGWVEGRNVAVEYRWAEGRDERYAEIAA